MIYHHPPPSRAQPSVPASLGVIKTKKEKCRPTRSKTKPNFFQNNYSGKQKRQREGKKDHERGFLIFLERETVGMERQRAKRMGQIVKRKKKGRPPELDPGPRDSPSQARDLRRSSRHRNVKYVFDLDDYYDEDELFANDEDRRRRDKKLKLLLKLNGESTESRRVDHAPPSAYEEDEDDEEDGKPLKKRRINDEDVIGEDTNVDDEDESYNYNNEEDDADEVREIRQEHKAEDSPPGTPGEVPSGLPLPDKKALELILDKLQKKDIYGVYAEPVDPEELPDYHDVIEHPMDFATVRKKLGNELYANFDQFESDVFLICSNAMQYNAPDTIYYKQARTIQELARRKFDKIRMNMERSEKEIKSEPNTMSNSIMKKQTKRLVSRTVQEPVGSDFSSGATLATAGDIQIVTNASQAVISEKPASIDGIVEANAFSKDNNLDKADDLPSGKGHLSRFGRKSLAAQDENRRATYNISLDQPVPTSESIFSTFDRETKQLVPVGLYSDHSYARSLSRFAATLGSVAWKVASKRIEQALPEGLKFGQGWVGEYEPLPTPVLMLENCSIKEPAFFTKVQPIADPRKLDKISIIANSSKESPGSVLGSGPALEQKLPFLGNRPPSASLVSSSLPAKEQPIKGNISEMKPSFFLSPRMKPSSSPDLSYQHQNLQSRAFVESDKRGSKQVELKVPPLFNRVASDSVNNRQIPRTSEMVQVEASKRTEFSPRNISFSPSGSFKRPESNAVGLGGLADARVTGNRLDNNKIATSSPDLVKPASHCPNDPQQGQGLSDPVQLMRMLSEKAQNQVKPSNISSADAAQVFSSAPSLSNIDSNNNAAAAAARAWMMSAAAGGYITPAPENTNLNKNQIHADSLYNSTRELQPQISRFNKNNSPAYGFAPQGHVPVIVGNEMQFQNQRMVFPQMVNADLSRFQMQSAWRSLSPQMHPRQKPESLPPDLNIGFQSSGSPGRPSSGVLVDSQQPDLALQL